MGDDIIGRERTGIVAAGGKTSYCGTCLQKKIKSHETGGIATKNLSLTYLLALLI